MVFQSQVNTSKAGGEPHPDDETSVPPAVAATDLVDPNSVDALLANELNRLSFKERDQITEEIHGVKDQVFETPSMVSTCLRQLEEAIWNLLEADDNNYMTAYGQAHATNSAYTTNPKFRLQFLRAERFNVTAAAQRMGRHFQQKLTLFGPDKLGQADITLQDLSDDDMVPLECGYMQMLSARDTAGRAVYFAAPPLGTWKDRSNSLRALWYLLNVELKDEETQKRGLVVMAYLMGYNTIQGQTETHRSKLDRRFGYHIVQLFSALPGRVEGHHFCCEDKPTLLGLKLALLASGKESRVRTRCHCGSTTEVFYALSSFGIPVHTIPVGPDGTFDLEPHRAWIETRRRKELPQHVQQDEHAALPMVDEESSTDEEQGQKMGSLLDSYAATTTTSQKIKLSNSGREVVPQPQDVLLGKLKVAKLQHGNDLLNGLIEDYRPHYERCLTKFEKMTISKLIVDKIKSAGGRFLKQTKLKYDKDRRQINSEENIGWVNVPDSVAREKISHSFRNLRNRAPLPTQQGHAQQQQMHPASLTSSSSSSRGVHQHRPMTGSSSSSFAASRPRLPLTMTATTSTTEDVVNNISIGANDNGDHTATGSTATATHASCLSCKLPNSIGDLNNKGCGWFGAFMVGDKEP